MILDVWSLFMNRNALLELFSSLFVLDALQKCHARGQ